MFFVMKNGDWSLQLRPVKKPRDSATLAATFSTVLAGRREVTTYRRRYPTRDPPRRRGGLVRGRDRAPRGARGRGQRVRGRRLDARGEGRGASTCGTGDVSAPCSSGSASTATTVERWPTSPWFALHVRGVRCCCSCPASSTRSSSTLHLRPASTTCSCSRRRAELIAFAIQQGTPAGGRGRRAGTATGRPADASSRCSRQRAAPARPCSRRTSPPVLAPAVGQARAADRPRSPVRRRGDHARRRPGSARCTTS